MSTTAPLEYDGPPSALAYMLRALGKRQPPSDQAPPLVARWRGHRPDPHALRRFLRLSGLEDRGELPLLYPLTFGFRLSMAVLTHPAVPVPIWGVLQVRSHVLQHASLAATDALDLETAVCGRRRGPKGLELDLHTRVTVRGFLAWECVTTFLARGRLRGAAPPRVLAEPPADIDRTVASWTMPDDAHLRFGAFTGDYNGIHLSDTYARRFGFERALYHPSRVLGQCLTRLPGPPPAAPQRLDVWLKGPVPHGARVRLHARPDAAAESTAFALYAEEERPSVVGRLRRVDPSEHLLAMRP